MSQVQYTKGDILTAKCSGGGGVGSPLERPQELVGEDVLNEVLSIEAAEKDYGVVIDPKTLEVDLKATEKLRAEREA